MDDAEFERDVLATSAGGDGPELTGPVQILEKVEGDAGGSSYQVSASYLVPIDDDDPDLAGVTIPVPVTASVEVDGTGAIVGIDAPPDPDAEQQARAFTRNLIARGAVSGLTEWRPVRRGPGLTTRPTHEVTTDELGRRVIRRTGLQRVAARSVPWRTSRTCRTIRWRVGGPPTRSTTPRNYPPGDIAKFDVHADGGRRQVRPAHARVPVLAGQARADRRAADLETDGRHVPASLVRRPEGPAGPDRRRRRPQRVLRPGEPAVLLAHVRRRDGQLRGERRCRDARAGPRLPRRHPSGFLRCARSSRSARCTRRSATARRSSPRSRTRLVREAVIKATPDLSANQFVESLAEALGDAIEREFGPGSVDVGALRHALNTFQWADPTTLPSDAPADELAGEVHSFARVFSGAFYDMIRNIYTGGNRKGSTRPAQGVADGGQAARGGHPGRAGRPEHVQRRRPADAPGRRDVEPRGERRGDQGRVRGARDDAAGPGHVAARAAGEADPRRGAPRAARRLAVPPGTKVELTPGRHRPARRDQPRQRVPAGAARRRGARGRPGLVPGVARVAAPAAGARSPASWARSRSAEGEAETPGAGLRAHARRQRRRAHRPAGCPTARRPTAAPGRPGATPHQSRDPDWSTASRRSSGSAFAERR